MRFKITLEQPKIGQQLPLSYQYALSSWIYRMIGKSNSEFSEFLHSKGFDSGTKAFKFFSFSQLVPGVGGYRIKGDRIQLNAYEISFEISFLLEEAAQYMVMGLFENQQMSLGDRISKAYFNVKSMELLSLPDFNDGIGKFETASPMVVSMPLQQGGKLMQRYLAPTDSNFQDYLTGNLISKYIAAVEHQLIRPVSTNNGKDIIYKLISDEKNVKSRLISIKAGTAAETKIRGFLFDFELEADPILLKLAYLAGLGNENALGFGAIKSL